VVDEELPGRGGCFLDRGLGLLLAADEEDALLAGGELAEEFRGLVEAADGFLEVDDEDATLVLHQVGLHLGVPFLGLVSEVDSSLDHLFDEFVDHVLVSSVKPQRLGFLGNPPRGPLPISRCLVAAWRRGGVVTGLRPEWQGFSLFCGGLG
jgi:hypothetical protein